MIVALDYQTESDAIIIIVIIGGLISLSLENNSTHDRLGERSEKMKRNVTTTLWATTVTWFFFCDSFRSFYEIQLVKKCHTSRQFGMTKLVVSKDWSFEAGTFTHNTHNTAPRLSVRLRWLWTWRRENFCCPPSPPISLSSLSFSFYIFLCLSLSPSFPAPLLSICL